MQLNEMGFGEVKPVDGYGPGFFRVGGEVFEGAVLIGPAGVSGWGGLEDAAALLALGDTVDVLLIGMGADIAPLPRDLRVALEAAGIAPEPMGSASAARTYNVLVSEGRRVAAALLPV
jgi:uncharacterized protein